ncbi:MAG TPA: DUF3775 domain-containing protein [Micropepsaceae bacterium]|jgi:hypothetical protein
MNQIITPNTELPPGVELAINPDKVCHIIAKARAFDAKEDISDPDSGSNASDDGMADVLEDMPDDIDATRLELLEFIRALDEEEQINLVALAWLGRGTYDIAEWREALSVARNEHNKRTAEYLLKLPLLGDYLDEGLAAFGENCDSFDEGRM